MVDGPSLPDETPFDERCCSVFLYSTAHRGEGSGTGSSVDPQSEVGGVSKAGSAACSVEASGHRLQAKVQAKARF